MHKTYKILAVIAAVLLGLGVLKDQIIKTAVEIGAAQVLGAPVHIGGMSVGLLGQSVRIKDLRVENPPGFPRENLIDIAQVGVDYDLPAIFKGVLHLPKLVLDLREMTVIKNKDGKLNVDALKVAQKSPENTQNNKPTKEMPVEIDVAELNLGKVIVKDYNKMPFLVTAYDIGVHHKTYRNIKSVQKLALLVMGEAMGPTALKNAAIYGAASVLGVAFLPAGVANGLMHELSQRLPKKR